MMADPLIVTATLDDAAFALLNGLRERHFPAALNLVPAHLTLFHALPGERLGEIAADLAARTRGLGPLPFTAATTLLLGRGVAIDIDCAALVRLRADVAGRWSGVLTAQDRAGFRPHVTIQNKVPPATARALRPVVDGLLPITGTIMGLHLWHYRGGPWEGAGAIRFGSMRPDREPPP